MHAFAFCLAALPLAIYLVALGAINLGRRPRLVGGVRDRVARALAISGFAIVGPINLFLPRMGLVRFGAWVWLLLLALYGLSVGLWILISPPRLVIYNCDSRRFRSLLAQCASELDPDCRWAGDCLAMPTLGVQLHYEELTMMRNVSLVSVGDAQDHRGWRQLRQALQGSLADWREPRNPAGLTLLGAGLIVLGMVIYRSLDEPQAIAQGFFNLLRL